MSKTKKDWAALPERAEEDVKRRQRPQTTPKLRGAAPLGPFTKKAARMMTVGRRKEGS